MFPPNNCESSYKSINHSPLRGRWLFFRSRSRCCGWRGALGRGGGRRRGTCREGKSRARGAVDDCVVRERHSLTPAVARGGGGCGELFAVITVFAFTFGLLLSVATIEAFAFTVGLGYRMRKLKSKWSQSSKRLYSHLASPLSTMKIGGRDPPWGTVGGN